MAYQFIHIDAASKAGRDIYTKKNGKKIITGHISTDSVLGEADRLDGYISHIENPLRPVILYGNKEKGIEDVRQKIEDWNEGTTDARGHKARKDANVLLSGVVSWPPINDGEDKNEYDDRRNAFEKELLAWLKKEYGDDLVLVLRHDDEPFKGLNAGKLHYHWHYYCVKKPGEKFNLHPGFNARSKKDLSRKDKKTMTADEIRAAMKEGRTAYREAMSDFQERYYQELGKYHKLGRFGPRRIRRSRSEQVEFEALIEKGIEASREIKIEVKEKAENEADEIIQNAIKKASQFVEQAKNNAKAYADETKRKAYKEATEIKNNALTEADEIKSNAEIEAQKTKNDAWKVAADIESGAKVEAQTILATSRNIVKILMSKISKLPGSSVVINWFNTFIANALPYKKNEEKMKNDAAKEPHVSKFKRG